VLRGGGVDAAALWPHSAPNLPSTPIEVATPVCIRTVRFFSSQGGPKRTRALPLKRTRQRWQTYDTGLALTLHLLYYPCFYSHCAFSSSQGGPKRTRALPLKRTRQRWQTYDTGLHAHRPYSSLHTDSILSPLFLL